jgi:hypothetical protein
MTNSTKPILIAILTMIFAITPITNGVYSQAQSPIQSCPNGLSQYTNSDLGSFSFCYDSSTTVTSNIGNASEEDKDRLYNITKTKNIKTVGNIEVTKNGRKLVFELRTGSVNYLPQKYCTSRLISDKNNPDYNGNLITPRRGVIDILPVMNTIPLNEHGIPYNGRTGSENNILNPIDTTRNIPGKLPDIYDVSYNAYIDFINERQDYNLSKAEENKATRPIKNADGTNNGTTTELDTNKIQQSPSTQFPFVIVPQGFNLPYTADKDKKIIDNMSIKSNAYEITKQSIATFNTSTTVKQNKEIEDKLTSDFLSGKGNCYDNTHRLYGLRLDSEFTLNNKNSDSLTNSPESNDNYSEYITPDNKTQSKINKDKQSNPNSTQPPIQTTDIRNLLGSGIKSIKIYSNSNELSPLTDTLESICWNIISCQRRDQIMARTTNSSSTINSLLTEGVISSNATTSNALPKQSQFQIKRLGKNYKYKITALKKVVILQSYYSKSKLKV